MNKKVSVSLIKRIKTTRSVQSSLILKDRRFAFSCGSLVYVYDLQNYKCDLIIKGHRREVFRISQLQNGRLVALSDLLKIFIITKNQYWCEFIYYPDKDDMITSVVQISNNRMIWSSFKPHLTFWNSNPPYKIRKTVKIGEEDEGMSYDGLYKMKKRKHTLLCYQEFCFTLFFFDYKICKTCYISETCVQSINNILETLNRKLLVSDQDYKVVVIDIDTLDIEKYYKWENDDFGTFLCFYELKRNLILCGGRYGDLYLLDLTNDTIKSIQKSEEDDEKTDAGVDKLIHIGKNKIINLKLREHYFDIEKINV